ncbi:serine hydrolase domain-containing protein [Agromyces aerolatus]|uniref:serine hydrolase domain-containing protein n=1 Tax=Agromyces sp. LY-1074 TaxID=3074080 RepID=UPI002858C745|nr:MULTISPECIES: serine hydrolase domain-containing protein [unclassified Agromyces]MDR5701810.1 serine hydrolase domain-containing protein [Agromyces sp. LY-1074]MDR5707520.1 serine hydrolase domain-containing protein [Agromyces sp. LY-1358]
MRAPLSRTLAAAAALATALALAACTGPAPSTPAASPTPTDDAAAGPTLKPVDEAAITALFEEQAGSFGQPGAVMLLRTPEGAALDADPDRVWQPEELVAMALPLPVDFEPGTGYHYSNTNTILLGLIAEQLEGKPLAEIYQERLFTPLGLTETSFPAVEDASLPTPHSDGYYWWTNVNTIGSSKLPPDLMGAAEAGTFLPNDGTLDNPSWAWSAGAGISTAGDLADWVEALGGKGGELLSPELQEARMNSFMATSEEPGAARYGWNIGEFGQFLGHSGELPGFNSFMGYDPVADVTLVVWANLAPAANGQGPAAMIARSLITDLYTS